MIDGRNRDYLLDIKTSIELINKYISGINKEEFLSNQENRMQL